MNAKTWEFLTPKEKDSLLKYLPPIDKQSKPSIKNMFYSDSFRANFPLYQDLLKAGEFDQVIIVERKLKKRKNECEVFICTYSFIFKLDLFRLKMNLRNI